MPNILTFILAGGKGERLYPLTKDRAKPAVPFGGIYRIIDFTLSNCINSGIRRIHILTQYKSISLQRHLRLGWNIFNSELGEYIDVIPAQQRVGTQWYRGTADAIYQNIYSIRQENPEHVLILAGDHVYKMDYRKMLAMHIRSNADMTVSVIQIPASQAGMLGVVNLDRDMNVLGFQEKPDMAKSVSLESNMVFASMGIYVFKSEVLEQELTEDFSKAESSHDFGRDIIPQMINKNRKVLAFNFSIHRLPGKEKPVTYWKDVGTIDAYFKANMDLLQYPHPTFDLYDKTWPIRTYQEQFPPARTISQEDLPAGDVQIINSLVSSGCIIKNSKVANSILSPDVVMEQGCEIYDSIIMEGARIQSDVKIKRSIIDKGVLVPRGARVGYDLEKDKSRVTVTQSGIVVVAKAARL
jgi:glucose-1-phosphate adenylyltransferase